VNANEFGAPAEFRDFGIRTVTIEDLQQNIAKQVSIERDKIQEELNKPRLSLNR
jgi:hypothetical protein